MTKEHILSYSKSKQLSIEDLKGVSAAGMTLHPSGGGGWDPSGKTEVHIDCDFDF